ncbi:MAG TPA: ParB/RepB/Spo0J family partition protein [Bacillota bacterium]|nr:ParB/RepB/Spo0J family partition protein [Bacillota bacterium]
MPNKILKTPTLTHYVEQVAGAQSPGVTELPLEQIDLTNTQFEYRLDPGLELLIESIKKDGQQIPVIVRGAKPPYQLICGFRRTRSIREIGGAVVKAIILKEIDDDKAHRLSVLENEERKSLTDLDRANACKRLQDEGHTQSQIAAILNTTQDQVSRYLSLLALPEVIFNALRQGRINTSHALCLNDLSELCDVPYIENLIEKIATKEMSVRFLRQLIGHKKQQQSVKESTPKTYIHRTKQGFKLIGFSYHPDLPVEEKQKAVQALKEALAMLEAELKGGSGE